MQMARAYAAFANGGYGVTPRFIEKIVDAKGNVLFQAPALPDAPTEDQRVIPARNAFVMASLLNEVTRTGTAAKAQATLKRSDIYGKTGTTNDAVDTWFAGFQPGLTTVVWMGHDDNTSLGTREFGATLALPIWIDYMRPVLKGVPVAVLQTPPGVQEVQGDWRYDEFVDGGYAAQIGMEPGNNPSVTMAPHPGDAPAPADMPVAVSPGATALPPLPAAPPAAPAPTQGIPITPAYVPPPHVVPSGPAKTPEPLERLPPPLR
jgi:penicillin-binding protein 1A